MAVGVFFGTVVDLPWPRTIPSTAIKTYPYRNRLNLLSVIGVAKASHIMTRQANTKLTPEVARELCQGAGRKSYVGDSIVNLGIECALRIRAVNSQNAAALAHQQVAAPLNTKVLDWLCVAKSKFSRGQQIPVHDALF